MNFDKWGLVFFINYFNQVDSVKKHLLGSLRELLLALSSTVEILQKTTERNRLFNRSDWPALPLKQIDGLIQLAVSKIQAPAVTQASVDTKKLKAHVVESIITVIDEEIEALSGKTSPRTQLKIEALMTVKNVLCQNLDSGEERTIFDASFDDDDLHANAS